MAVGTLQAEAGIWHYRETDLAQPRFECVRTEESMTFFRTDPRFDESGNLVGVTRTEERRSPLSYRCAGEMVLSDRFDGLADPEVPGVAPGMTRAEVRAAFAAFLRQPAAAASSRCSGGSYRTIDSPTCSICPLANALSCAISSGTIA